MSQDIKPAGSIHIGRRPPKHGVWKRMPGSKPGGKNDTVSWVRVR